MLLGLNFAVFSECLLMRKENCSVLETGALAIELHSYGGRLMPFAAKRRKGPARLRCSYGGLACQP
jgi:hypothetical protein